MFDRTKAFFGTLSAGQQQKKEQPDTFLRGAKQQQSGIKNVAQTVKENTQRVEQQSQAVKDSSQGLDYTKAFKPTGFTTVSTQETAKDNKAAELAPLDETAKTKMSEVGKVQTPISQVATTSNAAQSANVAQVQDLADQQFKSIGKYYDTQSGGLGQYVDDASRFLSSAEADMATRNLGKVAEMSETEQQMLDFNQALADQSQPGNVGTLGTISRWLSSADPTSKALASNIYGENLQAMRNEAGVNLEDLSRAKMQQDMANRQYVADVNQSKTNIADYLGKTQKSLETQKKSDVDKLAVDTELAKQNAINRGQDVDKISQQLRDLDSFKFEAPEWSFSEPEQKGYYKTLIGRDGEERRIFVPEGSYRVGTTVQGRDGEERMSWQDMVPQTTPIATPKGGNAEQYKNQLDAMLQANQITPELYNKYMSKYNDFVSQNQAPNAPVKTAKKLYNENKGNSGGEDRASNKAERESTQKDRAERDARDSRRESRSDARGGN